MEAPTVVVMPLPHGRDYLFYPDLHVLAFAPHLNEAGRERALDELYANWRASVRCLSGVPRSREHPATIPLSAV